MSRGAGRRAWRLALVVAAPGLAALLALVLAGRLPLAPALAAAAAILFVTGFLVARLFGVLDTLDEAATALAGADGAERAPRSRAGPGERAREILDLARAAAARLRDLEARRAAAETVVAALPDPLLVLDAQRRIIRANRAAERLVGPLAVPRDLATALRNPAVLAAADAVLHGAASRVVDFAVTVPIARHWRAHLSRIEPAAPGGAAAVLVLYDVGAVKRAEQMRADFIANASHELRT
ncbi:MAG TPA: PAS domain-containing protein, partial [Stellaceae bacterium]|nr:PAS domain-containing protein [Stellaceae bacterium]